MDKQKSKHPKRTKNYSGRAAGVRRHRMKAKQSYEQITNSRLYPGIYWKAVIQ